MIVFGRGFFLEELSGIQTLHKAKRTGNMNVRQKSKASVQDSLLFVIERSIDQFY